MASDLGASSPKTMCSMVIRTKAKANETAWTSAGEVMLAKAKNGSIIWARNGSPSQPKPKLARVMPSWVADRYASKWAITRRAWRAPRLPWAASASSWLVRTLTMAKLAGDEKAVEGNQKNNGQQLEKDHAGSIPTRCRAGHLA